MSTGPRAIPPSVNGWNAAFVEAEYERFKADPASVDPATRSFFEGFDLALASAGPAPAAAGVRASGDAGASKFQFNVDALVAAYRRIGHIVAQLDPFGRPPKERPEALTLKYHDLGEADLSRPVDGAIVSQPGTMTLAALIKHLEETYCRSIGAEFAYLSDNTERRWLIEKFEATKGLTALSRQDRVEILEQLTRAEGFENFIAKRYPGEKRFSLEGGESTIVLLNTVIKHAVELGAEEIVLGMAHRGRLNVLNNVMGKSYEQIFTEFEDNWEAGFADGGGDVKYHRGYSGQRTLPGGKTVHLAMASNPSHLESVNPVVLGRTRAKQRLRGDTERRRVIPVLVHGDAAIAGQGMVAECFNLSQLEGYTAGGCVHAVTNNLIGFTTVPDDARSSRYCTDVAKMVDAPIFHVNGEDPEAVVAVAKLAVEYRQQFRKDVVIDLYCYRKHGHNEQDEQSFTQPILAGLIKSAKGVLTNYSARLVAEGIISSADINALRGELDKKLDAAQAAAKKSPHDPTIDPAGERWKGIGSAYSFAPATTGVKPELLAEVCESLGRLPSGFNLNPKLKALVESRSKLCAKTPEGQAQKIAYADAETLAFGTLLLEGTPVRLSGQDCRRGTFTHRHAVLRDATTGEAFTPLNAMREMGVPGTDREPGTKGADGKPRQAKLCVYDSPLSEVSVMGFDYGYSLADPNMLVCWEAQFGDFVNGAQVIIDQYLASAELKWQRWSGLVLLLPHGYEGAGPEHSSCRLERFLQQCADDNMEVVVPSTAAQIFHLLRRQVRRSFRKPLIVATPKSLLRSPSSFIDELTKGSFREVIDDPAFDASGQPSLAPAKPMDRGKVKKVLLCTGKVFFELFDRRDKLGLTDVAIVRVEQLYPLHTELLGGVLGQYPKAAARVWVQEEPRNMGGYLFMADQFRTLWKTDLSYIGRESNASPAVGSKHVHKDQQEEIVRAAVGALPATPAVESKSGAAAEKARAVRASA